MEKIKTTIKPEERKFSPMGGDISEKKVELANKRVEMEKEENIPTYEYREEELSGNASPHEKFLSMSKNKLEEKLDKDSPLFDTAVKIMRDLATILTYSPRYKDISPEKAIQLAADEIAKLDNRLAIQKMKPKNQGTKPIKSERNMIIDAIDMATRVKPDEKELLIALRSQKNNIK